MSMSSFVGPMLNELVFILSQALPLFTVLAVIMLILRAISAVLPRPRTRPRTRTRTSTPARASKKPKIMSKSDWSGKPEPTTSWDTPAPTQDITLDYIMSLDWTPKSDKDD